MVNLTNTNLKGVLTNLTDLKEVVNFLPPDILSSLETLIYILKAAGVILIIYVIFLLIKGYFDIIKSKRIKIILDSVNEINNKLDSLLEKNKKKK